MDGLIKYLCAFFQTLRHCYKSMSEIRTIQFSHSVIIYLCISLNCEFNISAEYCLQVVLLNQSIMAKIFAFENFNSAFSYDRNGCHYLAFFQKITQTAKIWLPLPTSLLNSYIQPTRRSAGEDFHLTNIQILIQYSSNYSHTACHSYSTVDNVRVCCTFEHYCAAEVIVQKYLQR